MDNALLVYFLVTLVTCAICTVFGYVVGETKERGGLGAVLGFFFGPIGILIVALLPAASPPVQRRSPSERRDERVVSDYQWESTKAEIPDDWLK